MFWKCLLGDRIHPGVRTLLESLKCWIDIMAIVILTGAQRGAVYGLGPYSLQAEGLGLRGLWGSRAHSPGALGRSSQGPLNPPPLGGAEHLGSPGFFSFPPSGT